MESGPVMNRRLRSVFLVFVFASTTWAQSVWEVTPYQVEVALTIGSQPDLPEEWRERFPSQLRRDLKVIFRSLWNANVDLAPETLRPSIISRLDELSVEEVIASNAVWSGKDKIILVHVSGSRLGYNIRAREIDGTLLQIGPVETDIVDSLADLSGRTAQVITQAFSPLVRIDRYANGVAKTRLRAGSLMQNEAGVGSLQKGDVLLPFDRRVSSSGKTKPTDVRAVDWTYLLVEQTPNSSIAELSVVSGYKQPFRTKRNRRNQQLALRAKKTSDRSTIRLQTRGTSPIPLIGYEIHEKGDQTTNFIGFTNWKGELVIPENPTPIRTLLVRSGGRVTAKLPIVPGLRDTVVASMRDDRQRVEIDGFLSGIQTELVDLVARRESLAARIRRLIANQSYDDARKLLDEFRDLPTQDDFKQAISRQRSRLRITDTSLQQRLDTMFVQTSRTLGKFLDPRRLRELEAALAAAQ